MFSFLFASYVPSNVYLHSTRAHNKKGCGLILSWSVFPTLFGNTYMYVAPRECIASGTAYGIKFHEMLI